MGVYALLPYHVASPLDTGYHIFFSAILCGLKSYKHDRDWVEYKWQWIIIHYLGLKTHRVYKFK